MIKKQTTADLLNPNDNILCDFSNAIKKKRPILAKILDEYKSLTLEEYALCFKNKNSSLPKSLQSEDDFINICAKYLERNTGLNIKEKLRRRLTDNRNILTANHHGPLFCNIQLQGQILFALGEEPDGIMPVFAFGDVPLNNATYPRGIILDNNIKLPLFPDSMKNSLVSFVDSYTKENVIKAVNKVEKLYLSGQLTLEDYETVHKMLTDIFLDAKILDSKSYSEQSVLINMKLWDMISSTDSSQILPDIAYFEIEKIVTELLIIDLKNEESLIYNIFFREDLRCCLFENLDKEYGCWDLSKLQDMILDKNKSTDERRKLLTGSGTVFFWGVDSKKRRFPLFLVNKNGTWYLAGIDDSLNYYEIEFESHNIIEALNNQQLLPSLFTSFSVISFARNFICFGGFMQADYLTVMKNGLVGSLNKSRLIEQAETISRIPTENYCTGVQFILYEKDNVFYPAGTFNIISHGGLDNEKFNTIKKILLEKADLLGLPVKYPAVYRKAERNEYLNKLIINDIFGMIKNGENFLVL